MKKQIFITAIAIAACTYNVNAQFWQAGTGPNDITTLSPYQNLEIPNNLKANGTTTTTTLNTVTVNSWNINATNLTTTPVLAGTGALDIMSSYTPGGPTKITLSDLTSSYSGYVDIAIYGTNTPNVGQTVYSIGCFGASNPNFLIQQIDNTGRMYLGYNAIMWAQSNYSNLPNLGDYKLYVEDGILTEKVKVALLGGAYWPDYVFADDYKLQPLSEVEAFIKENKHLPGVASAAETEKNGIDVATMDATLLKKVEELTLYVIQQQKQIEQQQQEINTLKKRRH